MATTSATVHGIIHGASAACAAIGGGLAQLPGSDNAVITPIQLAMITAIAAAHGTTIDKAAAAGVLASATAGLIGRTISQVLIGWIPLVGNAINAATAAAVTEAVGWSADAFFDKGEHQQSAA
jgi:uncharacterized protein (DUF697 family)